MGLLVPPFLTETILPVKEAISKYVSAHTSKSIGITI
jgi:hypothetical protein